MSAVMVTPMSAALPQEVQELLASPDGAAFEMALDTMVRQREQHLFRALGLLARDLDESVRRFGGELADGSVAGFGILLESRQHFFKGGRRIKAGERIRRFQAYCRIPVF